MAGIVYQIDFAAAIARLVDGTEQGSRAVRKMADEMESASNFARSALASIGVALSGAAFAAAVKSAADAADAAAKMGDRFGIATEELIGMQHAADLAGVSNEGLTAALKGLAKSGIEAATGNEAARAAFQRLHIEASQFIQLPMAQQISLVIDKLGGMENAAVRNATAQALMGKQAGQVMGLVADGSEAFKKAAEDTEAWGLALNRVDAAKIELANDALKRAEAATKGVFTQISLALSPAVIALANNFADAKAEARGYRDEIAEGSDVVVQAIGYAGNFIQGLKFAWVGAKLAVADFADFTLLSLSRVLSIIPNRWGDELKLMSAAMHATATDIKAELDAVADQGLPADSIIANIERVKVSSLKAAQEMAAARQKFMKEGGDPGIVPFDKYKAGLANQLAALLDSNKTELAALEDTYNKKQALLNESQQKGIITDDFWQGQSMLLYAQYQTSLTKLQDDETKKRYGISQVYRQLDMQSAGAFFGIMAGMMSSHNRAAFEIGKAAAISQTVIDTYRAAQGAIASFSSIPYVGYALGLAAAAAITVAGLARVQQIRSTQFGGGGGATATFNANPTTGVPTAPLGSTGSGTTTTPATPVQTPVTINVNVINNGTIAGDDGITQFVQQQLVPALTDVIGNNDVVIIPQNSRQAQNLVAAAARV